MVRVAALCFVFALATPIRATEPGCAGQAESAKSIAVDTSMSFSPLAARFDVSCVIPKRVNVSRLSRFE